MIDGKRMRKREKETIAASTADNSMIKMTMNRQET
jgi:hypothetical protein